MLTRILLTQVLLLVLAPMAFAQSVVETFGNGLGGWSSSDGPSSLQNHGGALCVDDQSRGWLTLYASSRFHGLWGTSGGELSIRVKADTGPLQHDLIATISGLGGSASHNIPISRLSGGAWVTIPIDLEAAAWNVQGDWSKLTQDVTSFTIRIDLWDNYDGDEVNCIDDVKLLRGDNPRIQSVKIVRPEDTDKDLEEVLLGEAFIVKVTLENKSNVNCPSVTVQNSTSGGSIVVPTMEEWSSDLRLDKLICVSEPVDVEQAKSQ